LTLSFTIPDCFVNSRHLFYTLIGSDGYYISANNYFLDTFGFTETALIKYKAIESIHPDDWDACAKATEWCIQNPEKPLSVLLRKTDKNNEYIYSKWEFTLMPVSSTDQWAVQCIGFDHTSEIESRKKAKTLRKEIQSKDLFFEKILSNSIDLVLLIDKKGTIFYCSPNIKQEMGYEPEEMIGKNGFEFIHPNDLEKAVNSFEQELHFPDHNNSIDLRFRKKDGSWLWAEAKGRNMLNDPLVNGILVNLNDIEYRKKAELALSQSESRYRSFFNNLPYPLLLIEPATGKIISNNQSASNKYGYTSEELQAMRLPDLFEDPVSVSSLPDYYKKETELKHRTKSHQLLYVKMEQYNIQLDNNGYCLILIHDVTETHSREEESHMAYELSVILMKNEPLLQNLETALRKIRRFTGWDLLELWVPVYDHSAIRNDVSDFDPEHPMANKIELFIHQTKQETFTKKQFGSTPPFKNLLPHWIENLEDDQSLVRKNFALEAGFKSVLCVPVLHDGVVISSLYFFSFQEKKKDSRTEKLILTFGSLIGTEIEKRKSELVLDRFFKISADIMTIAGLDGRYLKVNPSFEKFIGYTEEEAKELHPLHFVFEEDRSKVLARLEELSKGTAVTYFENRVVTKTGAVKWIAWTATPVFDEGMVIATHRDITAQKEFEDQLKISNERYELATIASSNTSIWDYDIVNNLITRSKLFTKLFGYDILKENAHSGFWENNIHPEDRDRVIESITVFQNQSAITNWQSNYRFKKNNGTYAYIEDRAYLILDHTGKPIRVVGAMQDVTENKKLQDELIFQERTRQKQIAQAAVNAQEKERADIGKDLHDNISQMLTSTKLFLDILKSKTEDELLDRSLKNINIIIQEVRNLSRSLVPSSIEDLGLVASLNDLIESIRATNIIDLEFYPDAEVEKILNANSKLTLYRIAQEQINNIVKHAEAKNVLIELFVDNKTIELIITDNGKGFDLETVKKGQGLKNIKSRTELINGTSQIIAAPHKGCKLKIQIPII
jgi:PAS domain S-box-containing protein